MPLEAGTRIGSYEVSGPLGKGGMGEVYRARDAKLGRDVAVKVLPEAFANQPERLARFQREAKVLAALNHPNIATVYALEEFEGGKALVMELVEGAPVQGPLPVEQAVKVAIQIADALEAAHDKGITHRDIKPGNILLTPQGVVKVLDFGLAAVPQDAPSSSGPDGATAITLTFSPTQAGMILGTAGYMSPEQAAGQPVDRHADIWAFGVVLYELLTGKRLFTGDSVAHVLADVLRAPIDLTPIPEGPVRDLLARCLERDLRKRLHAIGEARVALENRAHAPVRRKANGSGKMAWAVAAGLAAIAGTLAFVHFREQPPERRVIQFSIPLPDKGENDVRSLAVSPDGRWVAVVPGDDPQRLWIRSLETQQMLPLAGTEGSAWPFWSPDSRYIAFFSQQKLKKIPVTGGPVQELCEAKGQGMGSWSTAGVIVFATGGSVNRVPASGGVPTPIALSDSALVGGPHFLPDGKRFLYLVRDGDRAGIYVHSLDANSNSADRLVAAETESMPDYDPPQPGSSTGHLLFTKQNNLMAQPVDPQSLQPKGDLFPIAEHVTRGSLARTYGYSMSRNGLLVFEAEGGVPFNQHVWYDRAGKQIGKAGGEVQNRRTTNLSPDGKKFAWEKMIRNGESDIWIADLEHGTDTRLTVDPHRNRMPVWSPDGSRIAFSSARTEKLELALFLRNADGTGQDEEVKLRSSGNLVPQDWSHDGRFLIYVQADGVEKTRLIALPMKDGKAAGQPIPLMFGSQGQLSPDGRWLAYTSAESGTAQVYVQPFAPASEKPVAGKWQISTTGGAMPRWRGDGKELFYYAADRKIMAVDLRASEQALEHGTPHALFEANALLPPAVSPDFAYSVTSDGKRFLMPVASGTPRQAAPLTVVVDWLAGVKK